MDITIMPPYVEPEHRKLIELAETALREHEVGLITRIKAELFDNGWNIKPYHEDIRKAERKYHEDPIRAYLLKQLVDIKFLCEKPRFMI